MIAAERLGELVRARRRATALRQDDLALVSGLGRRAIVDLERGKPTISFRTVVCALAALDLDLALCSSSHPPAELVVQAGPRARYVPRVLMGDEPDELPPAPLPDPAVESVT